MDMTEEQEHWYEKGRSACRMGFPVTTGEHYKTHHKAWWLAGWIDENLENGDGKH